MSSELLDIAIDLAHRAAALLRAGLERERDVAYKGRADMVTDVDRASEALIVSAIRERFPEHHILAEEGGAVTGASGYTWLIDPVDGTNNYVRGFPFFCVSLGLLRDGELYAGVVYDPLRNELFSGLRGGGAYCNGRRLRVSPTVQLRDGLLSTGFPYDRFSRPDNNLAEFSRVLMQVRDVRRTGSAALDLCYVAAGRSDGHWETSLSPWDGAAGALLILEAGGQLSDWNGAPWTPWSPHLAATNGRLHSELLTLLAGATPSR